MAVVSSTRRGGRVALRLAITNQRSRRADFDAFLDAVLRLGRELGPRSGQDTGSEEADAARS